MQSWYLWLYYSQLACPVVTSGVVIFACVSVHVCVTVGGHGCVCFFICTYVLLACSVVPAQLLGYVSLQWLAFLLFLEIVLAITAVSYLNSVCFFLL